jgi:hypothetical protein
MTGCLCYPVADPWTYYGIVEPGGAMQPNHMCPVHFPDAKPEWPTAPDDADSNTRIFLTPPACNVEDAIALADDGEPWSISGDELAILRSVPTTAWGSHRWSESEREEYVFYQGAEPTA